MLLDSGPSCLLYAYDNITQKIDSHGLNSLLLIVVCVFFSYILELFVLFHISFIIIMSANMIVISLVHYLKKKRDKKRVDFISL